MSNLFASLDTAAGALRAFQKQITVSQGNVLNETTPGYVKQAVPLEALPFQTDSAPNGGVRAGEIQTSRNLLAEQSIRRQLSFFGRHSQEAHSLSSLESVFDVSGSSGLTSALNGLFDAFANLAQDPNSAAAREAVISAASEAGVAFNRTANAFTDAAADLDADLRAAVQQINSTADQIRAFNEQVLNTGSADAGTEAAAFSAAESLSELVDVKLFQEDDGTLTVLLGGQSPLVSGRRLNEIQLGFVVPGGAPYPGGRPIAQIQSAQGQDISSIVTGGRLSGLLNVREQVLPTIIGNAEQEGDLNVLARSFAGRVNTLLSGGLVSQGPPAVTGTPLFAFNAGQPTSAAATLGLDPGATAAGLATIDPGPPATANGLALTLAELRTSTDPADRINGEAYLKFFGSLAGRVGSAVNSARQSEVRGELLTTQARDLRQQLTGVSLDQEAIELLQAQRSFSASSRVVNVVDELVQSVLALIR